ncbi:hypothetical protein KBY65_13670 [Cyanobium sp. Alchichica 3B3-8F6]|uniref:leucine zipper domain-containing protein n=1 Tax=Cyanobium sp. Alchichica 3B3-8F6 TaxID=2823696 RepID=UPI0020CE1B9D|nr:leucine zipper domain-containing protein [Cyanobium sp. Alchichica 3B3-8F6]MCP9883500.1 hypothetical protein [Cyanobium sp. Alchichica 3B3-8F6]
MLTHPNARLTPLGREPLLRRHIHEWRPLSLLTAEAGIDLRMAYKLLVLYRSGGLAALVN